MTARNTIICRCEDVGEVEALAAVERGARTARDLKLRTRIGMGACQGRSCGGSIAALLRQSDAAHLSVRPPVRPVRIDHVSIHGGDEA